MTLMGTSFSEQPAAMAGLKRDKLAAGMSYASSEFSSGSGAAHVAAGRLHR
jgi:hypothetical protein